MSEATAIFYGMSIRNLKRVEHGLLLMQARQPAANRRVSPQTRAMLAASDANTRRMIEAEREQMARMGVCAGVTTDIE